MPITGLRATDSFDSDARPLNWRAGILLRYPNGQMLITGLTSVMRSKSTDDPVFNWWERALTAQRLVLTAAIPAVDTTVLTVAADPAGKEVGGATQVQPGHLLLVEQTGEILRVTAVASDTSLTVARGFAGSTPATVTIATAGVNPNLRVIGTAFEENSLAPQPIMYDPDKMYNYTQIFRNTYGMGRTARGTKLRTVDQWQDAKKQCAELHGLEIEKAYIWGRRSEGVLNGNPIRTTGGILSFIPAANARNMLLLNSGTGVKWSDFEVILMEIFRYGSSEKMAICGNRAVLAVQQMVRLAAGQLELVQGQKEFGMNVSRLISPFGELVMKTHPLFNQLTSGTTGGTAYWSEEASMMILDMEEMVYRPFDDTMHQVDMETPGQDGKLNGYLSEVGLEIHHPENHFYLYNFHKGLAEG